MCDELLEKANTNAYLVEGFDADMFMLKLSIELGIEQPTILEKPFTSLKTMLENIVDIEDKEQFKVVKERLKLAKENVEIAISQFEKGQVTGSDEFKEVSLNLLKQEIIDLQLSRTYDADRLMAVEEKVVAVNSDELNALLSDVYVGFAYRHSVSGEYQKAIEASDRAIGLNSNSSTAYNNLGHAYRHVNDINKAMENFNKAISCDPNNASAYCNRGDVYGMFREYEKAINDYDKSISLNANNIIAYNNRGWTYIQLGIYDKAIEDLDRAIALDGKYSTAYKHRGVANMAKGRFDLALADLDFSIHSDPTYLGAYEARAELFEKMGDREKAEQDRAKAKELKEKEEKK